MELEVQDYPNLLRVVCWVLNGLELIAQNAILTTSAEGVAYNTFWLSSRSGKKLNDSAAELLAERVRDFLSYCSPRPDEVVQTEFVLGPISVSNTEHSQYTVIKVREQERTPGFLLEIASVLSGLNVQVLQGVIQGCVDCGDDVPTQLTAQMNNKKDGARFFEFWVRNQDGQKLQVGHVRALLYALGIGLGIAGQRFPLTPPNREIF
jgi:UTP:GlnB (protein PII) uridylyltransferase